MMREGNLLGTPMRTYVLIAILLVWLSSGPMGCTVLFPRPKGCDEVSATVQKAFQHRTLDELVSNISALPLLERLDAYVYGTRCIHPPLLFLEDALIDNKDAMWEAVRRMESELDDSERFTYLALILTFHERKHINLNVDNQLRGLVSKSLSRLKNQHSRAFAIKLYKEAGVAEIEHEN